MQDRTRGSALSMVQSITFPLNQKPARLYTSPTLVMGQMRFGTPCSRWPMHAHPAYTFEFVDQGAMWLLEPAAQRRAVMQGYYSLLQPDQEHSQEVNPHIRTLYISLTVERVVEVARTMGVNWRGFVLDPRIQEASRPLLLSLTTLVAELEHPTVASNLLFESLSAQITMQLVRSQYGGVTERHHTQGSQLAPEIQRALDFIHTHYTDDLSLERLAEVASLSPFYFLRLFKRQIGRTPHAYVLHLRLQQAALLLRRSETGVAELALYLGFASASHLASAFRHQYGVTPSYYRAHA